MVGEVACGMASDHGGGAEDPSVSIFEATGQKHQSIDDPPDRKATTGEKHQETGPELSRVEAVQPEVAEDAAQGDGDKPVFGTALFNGDVLRL